MASFHHPAEDPEDSWRNLAIVGPEGLLQTQAVLAEWYPLESSRELSGEGNLLLSAGHPFWELDMDQQRPRDL